MSDWICNKCHVGVLDRRKKIRSPQNGLEFVVICPECGSENPVWSFTSDDVPRTPDLCSADTGISMLDEPNYTIVEEGKEVGRFWFDKETGRFKFEGDMEASAQIFAAHILKVLNL